MVIQYGGNDETMEERKVILFLKQGLAGFMLSMSLTLRWFN